jgi:hypothetical protein
MLIYILLGAAAVVALLAVVVALQPAGFRIARTVKMSAPASAIFPHINDMRQWMAWSPWEKLDPMMRRQYEGASSGEGSVYSWRGDKNVGEGRCTILESRPDELVRMRLEFVRPFKATNGAEFILQSEGDETAVTWAMTGERTFMFKAMNLVMNMDKMCGGAFEQGLGELKEIVESERQASRSEGRLVGAGI